jgi:hypothetical protein
MVPLGSYGLQSEQLYIVAPVLALEAVGGVSFISVLLLVHSTWIAGLGMQLMLGRTLYSKSSNIRSGGYQEPKKTCLIQFSKENSRIQSKSVKEAQKKFLPVARQRGFC